MTFYGLFSPSVSALRGQSFAFQTISENIVNSTTPGFKRADTRFQEVVNLAGAVTNPSQPAQQSYGGMYGLNQYFLDAQGVIAATQRPLDVAINGQGFLVTNAEIDGSSEYQFTRAGQLGLQVTDNGTYLVDGSGQYVFGWPSDGNGGFSSGTALTSASAIQVDSSAFIFDAAATTNATFTASLPSQAAVGDTHTAGIGVYDASSGEHAMTLSFTKTGTNTWDVTPSFADGSTVTSAVPIAMTFDATGALVSPTSDSIDVTFPDASTTSVAVDFSGMTQYVDTFSVRYVDRDGNLQGELNSVSITGDGVIEGVFSNGMRQDLYKLALATFRSPNQLATRGDTHYAQTAGSGDVTLYEADETELGSFVAGAVEESNVSMDSEFTKMVITQQAYNSSAQVIRTVDEMMRVASDLKR
ncbi:MAG: flagellar hook protein FlgE [Alphaproteobacteria bacterium]